MAEEELGAPDMGVVAVSALRHIGVVRSNIDEYNEFLEEGVPFMATQLFPVDKTYRNRRDTQDYESFDVSLRFTKAEVGKPMFNHRNGGQPG